MSHLNDILPFLLSLICVLCAVAEAKSRHTSKEPFPCNLAFCSLTEGIVYVVENHQCYLYRNECCFQMKQCQRHENGEKLLKAVTRHQCMKYCSCGCTKVYAPLCAEYMGVYETFDNRCEMILKSCKQDKSYILQYEGECKYMAAK